MTGLTREIGEFVAGLRFEDIPGQGVTTVKNGVTDFAAVTILGRDEPVTRIVRSFARVEPGGGEARITFSSDGASALDTALVNGTAGHALDYDDVGFRIQPSHPSVVLAAAALAEGEALGRSGKDVVAAYVAGYEVWGELAARDKQSQHLKGWHPTCAFGAIGAAAACAHLRGLDAETAARATALAATQAGGLVGNFGSMAKPFHAGRAAQVGVFSARLAEAGMTAAPDIFEKPRGFLYAVSPAGEVDLDSPARLGERWWIVDQGVGFKLFPMCYGAHRAITGMLELLRETPFSADEVAEIVVELPPESGASLINHDPKTGLDGKFSGEFAMAMVVIAGRATLAEVNDAFIRRDDVRALMKKVRVDENPAYSPKERGGEPNDALVVALKDGRRLRKTLDHPAGHSSKPLDPAILWTKFADCTRGAMPEPRARLLFDRLQALDTLASPAELPLIDTAAPAAHAAE